MEPHFSGILCNLRDVAGVCFFPSFKFCLCPHPCWPSLMGTPRAVAEPFPQAHFWELGTHRTLHTFISLSRGKAFRDLKSQISFMGLEGIFLSEREIRDIIWVPPGLWPSCTHLSHPLRVTRFSFWDLFLLHGSCLWPTKAHPTQIRAVFPGTLCPKLLFAGPDPSSFHPSTTPSIHFCRSWLWKNCQQQLSSPSSEQDC